MPSSQHSRVSLWGCTRHPFRTHTPPCHNSEWRLTHDEIAEWRLARMDQLIDNNVARGQTAGLITFQQCTLVFSMALMMPFAKRERRTDCIG